ncbi:Crp/Fnr family transcriptional regulator [Geothrix sp. PMB-07]|uniref:Crp/Fnr family transcriptional regulator n=1 Tax=Geothrix sp. PMB-07 TaxID=3068640 RepID=UPI00274112A2|nr:Crp/Fnr family transcriptional regulator [Geothrix sp. PMB-07]WLT30698.1 Crp/Fnr family transcriptional regulator [Geothrix sp. PMB-07]
MVKPAVSSALQLFEQLAGCPLPEQEHCLQHLKMVRVAAGETVFQAGETHPYIYVVRKGLVKLCYWLPDGTERIKSFGEAGGLFASMAALEPGGLTSFAVVALEASELERVELACLEQLGQRHLAWQRCLTGAVKRYALRKEIRERDLLILKPLERYQTFLAAHPDLARRVPLKDLASYLGITAVSLSRIRARLNRATQG